MNIVNSLSWLTLVALLAGGAGVVSAQDPRPNVIIILADDMGYSDLGSFGGEIATPNIDSIAVNGLRFSQFYNTARCSSTRAALLSGRYPHKVNMGHLAGKNFEGVRGYQGDLDRKVKILPELLKQNGYKSYMSGKWHVANYGPKDLQQNSIATYDNTPTKRGFDGFYGTLLGGNNYFSPKYLFRGEKAEAPHGDSYYYTDAISQEAVGFINQHLDKSKNEPFFLYVAYTAPHWPLQAPEKTIAKYRDNYLQGWDVIRKQRYKKMLAQGLLKPEWGLSAREGAPDWPQEQHKAWQAQRMAVHAAMVDQMDQGVGEILNTLSERDALQNTLVIFLSDNGASAEVLEVPASAPLWMKLIGPLLLERVASKYYPASGEDVSRGNKPEVMPGAKDTFQTIGPEWAVTSNTPFRKYKTWVHEGGIATPLLIQWPRGLTTGAGTIEHQPGHVVDLMATVLEAAGIPVAQAGSAVPVDGVSLLPALKGGSYQRGAIYFEHEGNRAVRDGRWKLVASQGGTWELYDMENDRTEMHNLAESQPRKVKELSKAYRDYATRSGVIPWAKVKEMSSSWF